MKHKQAKESQEVSHDGVSRNTILEKKTSMNRHTENGHAEVIALAHVTATKNPDQELWGIEVASMDTKKQYFRICNCTQARRMLDASMDEVNFQRAMVEFVVDQIKKEEGIDPKAQFFLILMKPAAVIGALKPIELHEMYMRQIDRINEMAEKEWGRLKHTKSDFVQ